MQDIQLKLATSQINWLVLRCTQTLRLPSSASDYKVSAVVSHQTEIPLQHLEESWQTSFQRLGTAYTVGHIRAFALASSINFLTYSCTCFGYYLHLADLKLRAEQREQAEQCHKNTAPVEAAPSPPLWWPRGRIWASSSAARLSLSHSSSHSRRGTLVYPTWQLRNRVCTMYSSCQTDQVINLVLLINCLC